jgi:serine/threonine protein kinase
VKSFIGISKGGFRAVRRIREMMVDVGRVADQLSWNIRKCTGIGDTVKRVSELKPLKVGTLLKNRYKVEKLLSWDGSSSRYLTRDIDDYGIYELREFSEGRGIAVEREIVTKRLHHRGLVRRYDFFVEDSRSYGVLAYEKTPDLDKARRLLSDRDLLSIASNLAETLDFLHRHWMAHVDLSMGNIVDRGETQKIVGLSGCRLFKPPSTEGFREARKGDFLQLLDLLERLILRDMEESGDSSLLPFIRGFEELVGTPPISAEDFREGLFQCHIMEVIGQKGEIKCAGTLRIE